MNRIAILLPALLVATLLPPAAAQDDEVPDKRPEVKALVEQLEGHAKLKGKEDAEAVTVIDLLYQEFEQSGPKDRASIVKVMDKCLAQKRKQDENEEWDNQLFMAAAVSLGGMGPESVKVLIGQIGNKTHKQNYQLRRRLILSLGKTRDEGATKTLVDMLKDKEAILQGAAAEAMGDFEEADQKLRKDLFNELLKLIMPLKSAVDTDTTDPITRERYDIVSGPCITSFQRLTGQSFRDPNEWRDWWNDNKKADWDEES